MYVCMRLWCANQDDQWIGCFVRIWICTLFLKELFVLEFLNKSSLDKNLWHFLFICVNYNDKDFRNCQNKQVMSYLWWCRNWDTSQFLVSGWDATIPSFDKVREKSASQSVRDQIAILLKFKINESVKVSPTVFDTSREEMRRKSETRSHFLPFIYICEWWQCFWENYYIRHKKIKIFLFNLNLNVTKSSNTTFFVKYAFFFSQRNWLVDKQNLSFAVLTLVTKNFAFTPPHKNSPCFRF